MSEEANIREHLLTGVRVFVASSSKLSGITRIALIGSLVTDKPEPKDADVLITISEVVDLGHLAQLGRKLKGKAQTRNAGADIFLCSEAGQYLGRTCSYRECHPRVRCLGRQCAMGTWLCDDLGEITLSQTLIKEPPLEIWPKVVKRGYVPADVAAILLA